MPPLHPYLQIVLAALGISAAVIDIHTRRIPNPLVAAGIVAGFAGNYALHGTAGLKTAAIGFAVGFGVYFILYLLHAMGAGDVKLMGAAGAIAGPGNWFWIFVFSAVLGALFGLVLILFRGRLRHTAWNLAFIVRELMSFRAPWLRREELDVNSPQALRMPHGLAIGLGIIAFLAASRAGWLINQG